MTVGELIEKLNEFDPNEKVFVKNEEEQCAMPIYLGPTRKNMELWDWTTPEDANQDVIVIS